MILVVDIVKGMQTQTAECLVIGEITCSKMMVVLNKVDLLPESSRNSSIQKMEKKMRMTLSKTKFKDSPIASVSAKVDGIEEGKSHSKTTLTQEKLHTRVILSLTYNAPHQTMDSPCIKKYFSPNNQ